MTEAAAVTEENTEQQQTESTEAEGYDANEIASAFGFELPANESAEEDTETEAAQKPASKQAQAKAAKPAKGDTEEKATDPIELLRDESIFDAKALANQPGIGKARSALLAARKALRDAVQNQSSKHVEMREREARIKNDTSELNRAVKAFEAVQSRLNADIDILFNGQPHEVFETLGRLTRRSGADAYEALTRAALGAKKANEGKAQLDPETKAKLAKLDEMEARLKKYEESEGQRSAAEQEAVAREQWVNTVAQHYQADPDDLPNIKHFVDAGHAKEVMIDIDAINTELWEAAGRPARGIPIGVLLNEVDKRYSKLPRETQAEAKPAKKNGRLPGAGLSPARAATSGGARELTERERDEELAKDTDYLRGLGFNL